MTTKTFEIHSDLWLIYNKKDFNFGLVTINDISWVPIAQATFFSRHPGDFLDVIYPDIDRSKMEFWQVRSVEFNVDHRPRKLENE